MTIFSTFMMVLILAITGASVDIMYQEATRARLQAALDRAVLAAADLDQQQDPVAVVNDYVTKAGLAEHLTDVIATPGLNDRTVAADAGRRRRVGQELLPNPERAESDRLLLHLVQF